MLLSHWLIAFRGAREAQNTWPCENTCLVCGVCMVEVPYAKSCRGFRCPWSLKGFIEHHWTIYLRRIVDWIGGKNACSPTAYQVRKHNTCGTTIGYLPCACQVLWSSQMPSWRVRARLKGATTPPALFLFVQRCAKYIKVYESNSGFWSWLCHLGAMTYAIDMPILAQFFFFQTAGARCSNDRSLHCLISSASACPQSPTLIFVEITSYGNVLGFMVDRDFSVH